MHIILVKEEEQNEAQEEERAGGRGMCKDKKLCFCLYIQ